jgi:hypothetical protein
MKRHPKRVDYSREGKLLIKLAIALPLIAWSLFTFIRVITGG